MRIRPATNSDLQPIRAALQSYADTYSSRYGPDRKPNEFIDGRPSNIEDAGWLYYEGIIAFEGTGAWFEQNFIGKAMPWLVMNVLVESEGCQWIVIDPTNEIAITHRDLDRPITAGSLDDGSWQEEFDYDESPDPGEVALDSYDDLQRLFAKKRIFGTSRPSS